MDLSILAEVIVSSLLNLEKVFPNTSSLRHHQVERTAEQLFVPWSDVPGSGSESSFSQLQCEALWSRRFSFGQNSKSNVHLVIQCFVVLRA